MELQNVEAQALWNYDNQKLKSWCDELTKTAIAKNKVKVSRGNITLEFVGEHHETVDGCTIRSCDTQLIFNAPKIEYTSEGVRV